MVHRYNCPTCGHGITSVKHLRQVPSCKAVKSAALDAGRIGNKYGMLTIKHFVKIEGKNRYYFCDCECGNHKILYFSKINTGKSSCGCRAIARTLDAKGIFIEPGMKKHRLTAIKPVDDRPALWHFDCDCGSKMVLPRNKFLQADGQARSCGCIRREARAKVEVKVKKVVINKPNAFFLGLPVFL